MTDTRYERFPSLRLFDKAGCDYMVFANKTVGGSGRVSWDGPLWTGTHMMLCGDDGFGDEGFAHELFHWMVASPEQRRWPDMALGQNVNAASGFFAVSGGPCYDFNVRDSGTEGERSSNIGWGEPTVDVDVAAQQEWLACRAMFLYAPLVGLQRWSELPDETKCLAAFDFNGDLTWVNGEGSVWATSSVEEWEQIYEEIVAPLKPRVGFDTVRRWLQRFSLDD